MDMRKRVEEVQENNRGGKNIWQSGRNVST